MSKLIDKDYPKVKPMEWVQPRMSHYKMCCCDCGLVHDMFFRIVDNRVQFKARRNNRSTAGIRRWMRK